jgi:hypothetical protein
MALVGAAIHWLAPDRESLRVQVAQWRAGAG